MTSTQPHFSEAMTALFQPRSVVLVGASESRNSVGGRVVANVRGQEFSGKVHFVNPRHQSIFGERCFGSIRQLPTAPEHAVVMVPTENVLEVVREAFECGVKAVTVLSAGFAETGDPEGISREHELKRIAADFGGALLGPNCAGFVSPATRFAPTNAAMLLNRPRLRPGNISIISQSAGIALGAVLYRGLRQGLSFHSVVTLGNGTAVDAVQLLDHLARQDDVNVIGLVLESIPRPRDLRESLKWCHRAGKQVVVLKVGRSDLGAKAAMSHTASLTGDDRLAEGLLADCRALRAWDYREFADMLGLLSRMQPFLRRKPPAGAAVLTMTGGQAALLVDLLGVEAVDVPPLATRTIENLRACAPGIDLTNPLDLTGATVSKAGQIGECLRHLVNDPGIGYSVPILTVAEDYLEELRGFEATMRAADKPVVVLWTAGDTGARGDNYLKGTDCTLPWTESPLTLARVLGHLTKASRQASTLREAHSSPDKARQPEVSRSAGQSHETGKSPDRTIEPKAAWALLQQNGINTPAQSAVASIGEATLFAAKAGFPICLKLESATLLHKAEVGGVVLNLNSDADIVTAYSRLADLRSRLKLEDAVILAQEMVGDGILELIVSAFKDPVMGDTVMVGIGGARVELLQDVAFSPAPIDAAEAMNLLSRLKSKMIFDPAYSGKFAIDISDLAHLIERVSNLIVKSDVAQIELNPVIARAPGSKCVAVDAVVIPTH